LNILLSVQPIKYPLTGIGRYTYELAKELETQRSIDRILYINENNIIEQIPEADEIDIYDNNHNNYKYKFKRYLAKNKYILDAYRYYKSFSNHDVFSGFDGYIYHGPNFYLPNFPGKSVVTIHDLSVFTMPNFHPSERVLYLSREIESSIKRSAMIITDSDYIKAEIVSFFGLPEDRIGVAKLACGREFHPRTAQDATPALKAYDLQYGGYALYAGTIEPRKNLSALLEAYNRLPAADKQRYPLVLAGYKGWNNADIMERIDRGRREGWVKYLGFVPNDHLPALYAGAKLFVFPSLYEGFGLPILEAMASGVPVITTNRSSIPEVGSDAVLYTDPNDIDIMRHDLERGLTDHKWHETAILNGLTQAGRFSWKRCADDTTNVYRAAIDKSE
jgi:glycosyltransferase involved in cell wall biosynthesis